MRILFVSRSHSSHDARFLRAIVDAGHRAWFYSLSGLTSTSVDPVEGVEYVDLPAGAGTDPGDDVAMRVPAFRETLAQVRPDILHAGPVQDGGLLGALSGFKPFVLMSWGFDLLVDAGASERSKADTMRALVAADAFVGDSQVVEDAAFRYGLPNDALVVRFPWGVDLEMFTPSQRGRRTDTVRLLSTRRWEHVYGIETLIDTFDQAVRRDDRLRLTMLGGGSLAEEVRRRVDELSLSDRVEMPGSVRETDLPSFFQDAYAYLCCTPSDGSSISLLESLASGLPVVVADSPGNREWVTEGKHGWLVAPQEPGKYAEALLACSSLTESEYLEMRTRNRNLATERADWNDNVLLLLRLYDRIGRTSGREGEA